jgi:hypothetical protein
MPNAERRTPNAERPMSNAEDGKFEIGDLRWRGESDGLDISDGSGGSDFSVSVFFWGQIPFASHPSHDFTFKTLDRGRADYAL